MALPPARHPVLAVLLVAVLTAILAWVVLTVTADVRDQERLDALAPFYVPPDPLPRVPPGTILRSEPLGVPVAGGHLHVRIDGPAGAPWLVFSNSLATDALPYSVDQVAPNPDPS